MSITLSPTQLTYVPTLYTSGSLTSSQLSALSSQASKATSVSGFVTGLDPAVFTLTSVLVFNITDSQNNHCGIVTVSAPDMFNKYTVTYMDNVGGSRRKCSGVAVGSIDITVQNIVSGIDETTVFRGAGLLSTDCVPQGVTPLSWSL